METGILKIEQWMILNIITLLENHFSTAKNWHFTLRTSVLVTRKYCCSHYCFKFLIILISTSIVHTASMTAMRRLRIQQGLRAVPRRENSWRSRTWWLKIKYPKRKIYVTGWWHRIFFSNLPKRFCNKLHTFLPILFRYLYTRVRVVNKRLTRSSANADCTALRVWNMKRPSFLLGWVHLGLNFTGTGSSSAKILIPIDR